MPPYSHLVSQQKSCFLLCNDHNILTSLFLLLFLTLHPLPFFQVFAAYDFMARGNHEVSIRAGEPVRVLEPHDKRGNPEWSLVEARSGQRGYVPSNYLAIVPMATGQPGPYQPYC